MKKNKKIKLCLISSSGGHWEQLKMLFELKTKYQIFTVTEKTDYNKDDKKINYFIMQVNRKEKLFVFKMIGVLFKSLYIYLKERPDIIISTGVLSTIPLMFIAHFFKSKVVYIESFAKINNPTMTGKLIYKYNIADQFYVQWESMLKYYPKAIFKGGIY